jgi:hypothetical protein
MQRSTQYLLSAMILSSTLLMAAYSDNNTSTAPVAVPPAPTPVPVSYAVTVTNLTAAQPFSPVAVVLHDSEGLWQVGQAASAPLEQLAESGDNSDFLQSTDVLGNANGGQIIAPGDSQVITVTINDRVDTKLTTASMLVNTNDAFAGLDSYALDSLTVGDVITMRVPALDAGTELNDEAMGTIPGPADNGEGFNAARESRDTVAFHSGVVSAADGLTQSTLDVEHQFDNAVMLIRVKRTQ